MRPRLLVPVFLAAALLVFAFSISDAGRVWSAIAGIPIYTMAGSVFLAALYLLLKGAQFRFLLERLGIGVPWRVLVLAFVIGEMTLPVPSGIYLQNYVLKRIERAGFARSSAATTMTLLIEGALVLFALAVFPVPGWEWLRPLAVILALLGVVVLGLSHASCVRVRPPRWLRHGALANVGRGLQRFLLAMRRLSRPAVLLPAVGFSVPYMAVLVLVLLLAAHGTGVLALNMYEAVSIYAFSLAVTLALGGIVSQLGVIEVAGMGAAHAWGYSVSESLGMLLGFRLVWTASIWLLCAPTAWSLRGEFRRSRTEDVEKPVY